jgi:glycosyltransferase involved in cell wall biosynthesis
LSYTVDGWENYSLPRIIYGYGIELNLFLDQIIYWLQPAGGISTYWYELCSYFSQQPDVKLNYILQSRPANGLYSPWINSLSPSNIDNRNIKIARYLRAPLPKSANGIFHSSYYRMPGKSNVTQIVTVHDFTYEYFRTGLPRFIHGRQKEAAVRAASGIICISENTKTDLLRFMKGIDEKRIVVIPHGVSTIFRQLSSNSDSDVKVNYKRFALFVGERSGYKNFGLAVAALKPYSDLHLVVVGKELALYEQELLSRELPSRWEYAGRVSNEALNVLYNQADALLYPSSYEGFGMPILEAMRAGCPVICSNLSSLPEVAGDAAILVESQTGEGYADALDKLSDVTYKKCLIQNGLRHSSSYTWDKCFKQTFDFYIHTLNKK